MPLKTNEIYYGDCLDLMQEIPDSRIDLILTDPPYYKIRKESWDRQWSSSDKFLQWLNSVFIQFQRVLKGNGSLYCFTSSQMAPQVEGLMAQKFRILNRIIWVKPPYVTREKQIKKEDLRRYLPITENIIFAEQFNSEYEAQIDRLKGFIFEPLRKYLVDEWKKAGLKNRDAKEATGSFMNRHYFSQSQWTLPTEEKYNQLKEFANRKKKDNFLKGYEDLRREYEDLRRPFNLPPTGPHVDVWNFQASFPGDSNRHPCEKPVKLLSHIIQTSSQENALILDCFAGTGNTGIACRRWNRNFILIEKEPRYYKIARRRLQAERNLFNKKIRVDLIEEAQGLG